MVDLTSNYLGLQLKNPLVASASPLSKKADSVKRLEDAGISAVVMFSLFEEQITHEAHALDYYLKLGSESFAEAITYFPNLEEYSTGPEEYLTLIEKLKKSVEIPVIASLNGVTSGGWVDMACKMQQAGADALELNIYFLETNEKVTAQQLEKNYIDLIASIRKQIHIPLAVKISPFFTVLPNFAKQLVGAGANGLVLFNRFYQPDLDVETLEVVPNLEFSTSSDLRLPLRWTAILYGRTTADLAISGGVHTGVDIVKALMAGACVTEVASELLARGTPRATEMLGELEKWLEHYEYESVGQMRGSMSQRAVAEPSAFERANYMKALTSISKGNP